MKKKTILKIIFFTLITFIFSTNLVNSYTYSEIDSANYLASKGIIVNNDDNISKYGLDNYILRQELAGISLKLLGLKPSLTCEGIFKDISDNKPNDWICGVVEALFNSGVIAKNEIFRPEDNISKGEALGIIIKTVFGASYNYNEKLSGNWQEQLIDFASKQGIIDFFKDYDSLATRGFVFELTKNALLNMERNKNDEIYCNLYGLCNDFETYVDSESDGSLEIKKVIGDSNNILMVNSKGNILFDFDIINNTNEDIYINKILLEIKNDFGLIAGDLYDINLYRNGKNIDFSEPNTFDFHSINELIEKNSSANFMVLVDISKDAVSGITFDIELNGKNILAKNKEGLRVLFKEESLISKEYTIYKNMLLKDQSDDKNLKKTAKSDGKNDPIVKIERFTPTGNELYRFSISSPTNEDVKITSIKFDIAGEVNFSTAKLIISRDKMYGEAIASAELNSDFSTGEVVFSMDKDLGLNQVTNIFIRSDFVIGGKRFFYLELDDMESDKYLKMKGKKREISISEIKYLDKNTNEVISITNIPTEKSEYVY